MYAIYAIYNIVYCVLYYVSCIYTYIHICVYWQTTPHRWARPAHRVRWHHESIPLTVNSFYLQMLTKLKFHLIVKVKFWLLLWQSVFILTCTGFIYLSFLHCVFSMYSHRGWMRGFAMTMVAFLWLLWISSVIELAFLNLSPLCVFKRLFKVPVFEDA